MSSRLFCFHSNTVSKLQLLRGLIKKTPQLEAVENGTWPQQFPVGPLLSFWNGYAASSEKNRPPPTQLTADFPHEESRQSSS